MLFYVGIHEVAHAQYFERAFISINRIRNRKKQILAKEWIMDSGAFSEISTYGKYRYSVDVYADEINRLYSINPNMIAVVAQDYMCEPWIIQKTGLSIEEHQQLTIERYDALIKLVKNVYIMPVLQGYSLPDYLTHLKMYGNRLKPNAYVGIGSICKRNTKPDVIRTILKVIKLYRPDVKLHGFGVKTTALTDSRIRSLLYSADSMAWAYHAYKNGRCNWDWREAKNFSDRINALNV